MAAHPGYAATNLQTAAPILENKRGRETVMRIANTVFAQSAADGARPTLHACLSKAAESGAFYGPAGPVEMRGKTVKLARLPERADNHALQERLWTLSEDLTGVSFSGLDQPVSVAA
jgi:hypothetical protein